MLPWFRAENRGQTQCWKEPKFAVIFGWGGNKKGAQNHIANAGKLTEAAAQLSEFRNHFPANKSRTFS